MRKRGRVDVVQHDIVVALRSSGNSVVLLSNIGDGVPDLLVKYNKPGFGAQLLLMEVKSPHGRMTSDEQDFYNQWQECMVVVYSIEDALKATGNMI
jgi:hypothetical protein